MTTYSLVEQKNNIMKNIKFTLILLMLLVASKSYSQDINLKEYCIVGYYGPSAIDNFKLPFIITFGENNTAEKLESDGRKFPGKVAIVNGTIKVDYGADATEDFKMNGLNLTPRLSRTFAVLQKIPYANILKEGRYTGLLFKQRVNTAMKTNYQFIGEKIGISDDNSRGMLFHEYTLINNMAGFRRGNIKSNLSFSIFVRYGNQLLVLNNFKNPNEGATYGTFAKLNK